MNNILIYIVTETLEGIEAYLKKIRATKPERALSCEMTLNAMKSVCSYILILDEIEDIDRDWRTFTLAAGEKEILKNVNKYIKGKKRGIVSTKELRKATQNYISDLFWMELDWYENL